MTPEQSSGAGGALVILAAIVAFGAFTLTVSLSGDGMMAVGVSALAFAGTAVTVAMLAAKEDQ